MSKGKTEAVAWLRAQYRREIEISPLGETVAWVLERLWGIHNAPVKLEKVDWSNNHWIEIVIGGRPLATIDGNELTCLVVIAHELMLRVSIEGAANRYLRLMFHQRTSRDRSNGLASYCPDIYTHVDQITGRHSTITTGENNA